MFDLAIAIEIMVPAAKYFGSVTDNTEESYLALDWLDEREKPTWQDINEVYDQRDKGEINE